jgi:16S rRNA A1518/A1519 N6-dimethyltransferase RsmA/KsgA/DIM1 with predicted DNA glycosylase/AP lyase activity
MKRRVLGQHYLVDSTVIERMIEAAELKPTDSVVEIGTGKGALTEKLAGHCLKLDGYEVDPGNYRATLSRLGGANAHIHLMDGFQRLSPFGVLVSSLPYSRSRDFIEWISRVEYQRGVVLLQEDFVKKVLSKPGARDYRAVAAITQISSEVKEITRVGRNAFDPPPKVNSMIVFIRPRRRLLEGEISNVKKLFSLRRRRVSTALRILGFRTEFKDYGSRRVSSLLPVEVYEICRTRLAETSNIGDLS